VRMPFAGRHGRRVLVVVASLTTAALVGGGVAYAASQPAIDTITPKTADQITNIDVLRQQIRNYYGDPNGTGTADPNGNYAKEVGRVEAAAKAKLAGSHPGGGAKKAIVLDVDDTTLLNWNYEVASNWAYNPTTNAEFVTDQKFPAVFGMVDLVRSAQQSGYAIFFITGRPAAQEPATLGNLGSDGIGVDAGYPAPTALPDGEDGLFTKPDVTAYPDYLKAACADDPDGKCTTIHYKSATRAHIESLGYDIVLDFGDQDSDLTGGYTDRTVKLPNPNYYLP
jgi:hypothetical protein